MKRLNKKENKIDNCSLIKKIDRALKFLSRGGIIGLIIVKSFLHHDKICEFIDKTTNYEITDEKMIDLINDSNKLSDEEKEYLINEELLADIEETINNGDNGILISYHLDNMDIVPMSEKDKEQMPYTDGYYDELRTPKKLNIRNYNDQLDNYQKYVISHEFIHSLESCPYIYIREGFTSIVNSEYYTYDSSYSDEKLRLKVLMETIGTRPIWESAFARDASLLDGILDTYLTPDESLELKNLFKTKIGASENIDEVNNRIDELLSILYYNIHGKSIDSDRVIYALYNQNIKDDFCNTNRKYFNPKYNIDTIRYTLNLDTAERLGYFEKGVVAYNDTWVFEDVYEKEKDEWFAGYSCIDKSYTSKGAYERLDYNTYIFYDSGNEVCLTRDEAIKKGYLRPVVCLRKEEYIYDVESIKDMMSRGYNIVYTNEIEEGIECHFIYNEETDKVRIEESIPNIHDKFDYNNIYQNNQKVLKLN